MTGLAHPSAAPNLANAVTPHFLPETFQEFAFAELAAAPLHRPGRCFNPGCGRAFTPGRAWQIYCGEACKRVGTAELRAWGHRMALALLAWRMGKYETEDAAVRARTAAARRFLSQAQTAWVADRRARQAAGPGAAAPVKKLRMRDLAAAVAAEHRLTLADLTGPSRLRRVAWPRQELMVLAVESGFSREQIARFLRRDRTTIQAGISAVRARKTGSKGVLMTSDNPIPAVRKGHI